jgi:hypothetical protein
MKRCGGGFLSSARVCPHAPTVPPTPEQPMAPRRDGGPEYWQTMYLWRAVDHEGEVLEMLVQRRRDKRAALRLMRKLLKKQGFTPKLLTTDKLGFYGVGREERLRGGFRPIG